MSTVMDETTGLPELPEGYWWEVRKHVRTQTNPYGFRLPDLHFKIEDGYEVCAVTKKTLPASTTRGPYWWSRTWHNPESVVDSVVARSHITDPELYQRWAKTWGDLSIKVGKEIIEPCDVLKAAFDVMDKLEVLARKEASEALVGAYPPKTLWVGTYGEVTE